MPAFIPVVIGFLAMFGVTADKCQKEGLTTKQCVVKTVEESVPDYSDIRK